MKNTDYRQDQVDFLLSGNPFSSVKYISQGKLVSCPEAMNKLQTCSTATILKQVDTQKILQGIDPTLYLNRWIAVVHGRVIGVGLSAQQAHRAAMQTRSKDKPWLIFIDADGNVETLEARN